MFAGTSQAVGAEDAWYLYGVQLENAKLRGDHTARGSTDIFIFLINSSASSCLNYVAWVGSPLDPFLLTAPSMHNAVTTTPLLGGLGLLISTLAASLKAAH